MSLDAADIFLSALALLISLWAIATARKTANRQTTLQQRLLDLENARERDRLLEARAARLTAQIVRAAGAHRFVVTNSGRGQARNIRIDLDGKPFLEHRLVPQGQDLVTTLGPGGDSQYLLAVAMGAPPKVTARISWDDDTGQPGLWQSDLTVF